MPYVFVSIGSNVDREHHVTVALDELHASFGDLSISPVYESEAVGFKGEHFHNLVAGFQTPKTVAELAMYFRDMEARYGRHSDAPRKGPCTLDIDLLSYDDLTGLIDGVELPRAEITQNAFVLLPLSDIAGDVCHPVSGQTYRQLWQSFPKDKQKLWSIPFSWRGRLISSG